MDDGGDTFLRGEDLKKAFQDRVERFFRGRKNEETKEYVWIILDLLAERKERAAHIPDDDVLVSPFFSTNGYAERDWVRSKDLVCELVPKQIPREITLFRLLDALSNEKLIERRVDESYSGKGKKPVYYRQGEYAVLPHWAESRQRLIKRVEEMDRDHTKLQIKYKTAINLLEVLCSNTEDSDMQLLKSVCRIGPDKAVDKLYDKYMESFEEVEFGWVFNGSGYPTDSLSPDGIRNCLLTLQPPE